MPARMRIAPITPETPKASPIRIQPRTAVLSGLSAQMIPALSEESGFCATGWIVNPNAVHRTASARSR